MTDNGRMNLGVSLLVLAGLGLMVAGGVLAPDNLPTWLLLGGGVLLSWALRGYRAGARKHLDPRLSERTAPRTITRDDARF